MSVQVPMTFQQFLTAREDWPRGCFFEPEELLISDKALEAGLDNLPTRDEWEMLKIFARLVLRPVRLLWKAPLIVESCFRDPAVNKLAGGTDTSDHRFLIGGAADLRPLQLTEAAVREFFRIVAENALEAKREPSFDQLVLYPNRVHIGWRPAGNRLELKQVVAEKQADDSLKWSWPLINWAEFKKG